MRALILATAFLSGVMLAYDDTDDGSHAVQTQLDLLYAQVPNISEGIRNTTHQLNSLCVDLARAQGMHECDAVTYCEVAHD